MTKTENNPALQAMKRNRSLFTPDEYATITQALQAKSGWMDIESAPKDGTQILVKIYKMSFAVEWHEGFIDEDGNDVGCWVAQEENHHPPCWTDGICWQVNENAEMSEQPTHWMPTPPTGGDDEANR